MDAQGVAAGIWVELGGGPDVLDRLTVTGATHVLPSVFPVTAAATGAVAAATMAVAELWRHRGADLAPVAVDARHAALACRSERIFQVDGQQAGDLWDPLSGTYPTADGWIRLHTTFRRHRRAALDVLDLDPDLSGTDRLKVGQRVARWGSVELEDAIYSAGGCAGALRSRGEWQQDPAARDLDRLPLVAIDPLDADPPRDPGATALLPRLRTDNPPARPLERLRVLDLTRVIAGPVAGRFLAAYGAEVLRVDAPEGEDAPVTVIDTTVGKRSTFVDLRSARGRPAFDQLVADADVVLCAYRPGALEGLGRAPADLVRLRPGLVVGTLSAYGGPGVVTPWGGRRGFDSLVQMVTGLADEGRRATDVEGPVPLPAQLLDHMSGYLLATGVLTALARRARDVAPSRGYEVRVSLARTSGWLDGLGRAGVVELPDPPDELPDDLAVDLHGPLGHTRHIACPGVIVGAAPRWLTGPVPLGSHPPSW